MANCKVESVTAPDGSPSVLYEQLLNITGDQSRALELYLELADTAFPANDLNYQGEANMEAVLDMNILRDYEKVRYERGPSSFNQDSIDDEVIAATVQQIDRAIHDLNKTLNSSLDESQRANIEEQINKLKEDRRRVANQQTIDSVRKTANRQLDWANKVASRNNPSIANLMQAVEMMDMWDYDTTSRMLTQNEIQDENAPFNELFQKVGGRAKSIQERLVNKGLERIKEEVNKTNSFDEEVTRNDLTTFEDIGMGKKLTFNISHVDDPLIGHFHQMLVTAKSKQEHGISDLKREFEELEERSDVNPENLLREDENGNKTAELIGPFSNDYYSTRSKIKSDYFNTVEDAKSMSDEDADEAITQAKRQMYKDLNDIEELIDVRIISDELESDKTLEEYREELKKRYEGHEDYVDYAIEKAKGLWLRYKSNREDYKDYLDSQVKTDNIDDQLEDESREEWKERKLREYQMKNSPALYVKDRQDPSSLEFSQNTGWEHTFSLPKSDEEFFNENFNNLSEGERQMWDLMTSKIQESLSMLPPKIRRNMDETFLPKVKRDLIEMASNEGMMEAIRYSLRGFMEDITSAEDQSLLEEQEEVIPNPFEQVETTPPIKYLGNEDIDSNEISKDPIKAVQMFYGMALNYRKMTNVAPQAKLIHRIISESNKVTDEGKISEGAPVGLKDKVKSEIEFLIANNRTYEEEMKSEVFDSMTESPNPAEWWRVHNKKKSLENDRDRLKRAFENNEEDVNASEFDNLSNSDFEDVSGSLTENEYDELLENLDNQYKDLGGKSLIWSSLIDNTLLSWGQMQGMAINVGASLRNVSFGIVANLVHAAGSQEFTDKDLINAMGAMMKDFSTRKGKVASLVQKMGILYDTAEVRTGQDRKPTGGKDIYYLQNRTEYIVQGMTMIATMMNETVTDANGNQRSVWEAYDSNGNWKTEEFGERPEWRSTKNDDKGRQFDLLSNRIKQLNNRLHGDYSKYSDQVAKKSVWGRLVFMFRTWIPEVFAYRFGGPRDDYHLGREVTGSYRGTIDAVKDNPIGTTFEMLQQLATPTASSNLEDGELNENQKAAISRTAREIQIYSTLAAAVMALEPPEDEESSMIRKVILNNLIMLKQDVGLYMGPTRIIDLAKNPFPATRVIMDFDAAMKQTQEYLMDKEFQGNHPIWSWTQLMPVFKQANTIRWESQRILEE